ncbi:GAF domain-containing sensor histidine kinase [Paenibacillus sp. TRM 82003]|nr:GAF domain-containing sensor histidine kinase [Paenibacillus sp. TRM 82003]
MGNDHVKEPELLREIAETINRAYDMDRMLADVLAKLLELTGLRTGWVFLFERGRAGEHRCAADACLPPALEQEDKRLMRGGDCWCVDRFRDGRLQGAVNILHCKRIEDAIEHRLGDTAGVTHHATIPLRSGDDLFGLLNVASPGKTAFSDAELAMLQSVAYQIGTAAHRIRLYAKERKRAALYERLGDAARRLRAARASDRLAADVVRDAGEALGWPHVALWVRERQGLYLHAAYERGRIALPGAAAATAACDALDRVLGAEHVVLLPAPVEARLFGGAAPSGAGAAVPVLLEGRPIAVLTAAGDADDAQDAPFDDVDADVLEALSAHVALTYEHARLQERNEALARWEERNRIARDLHDSVSQMLFSLQLHARGLESALRDAPEGLRRGAAEIGRLSREALTEMRGMIRQLRPSGLEEGLLTGLAKYGASIGVRVAGDPGPLRRLPERVEQTLFRIGQEALNNVSKHAGVTEATVALAFEGGVVVMTVQDEGAGIAGAAAAFPGLGSSLSSGTGTGGFGMATMRERAESVGGTLELSSAPGAGTRVSARLPLAETERGEGEGTDESY